MNGIKIFGIIGTTKLSKNVAHWSAEKKRDTKKKLRIYGLASAHHWRIDHFTVKIGAFFPGVVANKIIPITNKGKIIEIIIFIKGNSVWLSASRDVKGLNPVSIEMRYITPTIIPITNKNIGDKKNHRPSFLHMLFMTKNKIQYIIVSKKCFLSKNCYR